jgi:hypothetical protein
MRVLNTTTLRLEQFTAIEGLRYAILSHTWGKEEVLFNDIAQLRGVSAPDDNWRDKAGASKVINGARVACDNGYQYIWIDTC